MSPPIRIQKISYFQKSNSTRLSNKASFCDNDLTKDLSNASQQLPLNSSAALLICKSQIFLFATASGSITDFPANQLPSEFNRLCLCIYIEIRFNTPDNFL